MRSILDYLCQDKIATLQAENNDLRRAASQDRQSALLTTAMAAQTNQIIDAERPTPVPSFPAIAVAAADKIKYRYLNQNGYVC